MTKPRYRLELFEGGQDDVRGFGRAWFWRLRSARNRRIVCIGGEGFRSRSNALRSFRQLGLPDSTWEMG